jgi:hypothetical protein
MEAEKVNADVVKLTDALIEGSWSRLSTAPASVMRAMGDPHVRPFLCRKLGRSEQDMMKFQQYCIEEAAYAEWLVGRAAAAAAAERRVIVSTHASHKTNSCLCSIQ